MRILLAALLTFPACARRPAPDQLLGLAQTFAIEVHAADAPFVVEGTHGSIEGAPADARALSAYAPILAFEFGLYPPSFVRNVGLERIVLCTQLAFAGQLRAAVPDFGHATLYLDVERGGHDEFYQRRVIHHEFYHMVDWRDDGLLYRDDAWADLNPEGFEYGPGGERSQDDARMSLLTFEHPGFLTLYARTGVEEDKAELFSFLFVQPASVAERCTQDSILARKVERLRSLLGACSQDFVTPYWARIAALERR